MSIFNIETFKGQISNTGFLQTNKYTVVISPNLQMMNSFINSPYVSKNFFNMTNELQYRCINATLPGMLTRTSDNNRFGLGVLEKMPYSSAYTDIDLTFLCDRFGAAYNFWYGWLNFIFASVGKETKLVVDQVSDASGVPIHTQSTKRDFYTAQYKNNYVAQIDIFSFDNYGNSPIQYSLYQAFPISINDSNLAWEEQNNLLKITVKITFREWALADGRVTLAGGLSGTTGPTISGST